MCILPAKAVPEMTYTLSGGMLNPTHSLTHSSVTWLGYVYSTCCQVELAVDHSHKINAF